MKTKVTAEKSIPPLKNLEHGLRSTSRGENANTYALPSNSTPVPTKDFNNCAVQYILPLITIGTVQVLTIKTACVTVALPLRPIESRRRRRALNPL